MHNSLDSSDISLSASGSRLLSQSPILPSSHTGLGGDDFSLSELSLTDRTPSTQEPFSLLAPAKRTSSVQQNITKIGEDTGGDVREGSSEEERGEQKKSHVEKLREDKLQSDIFILRKLNASFALFNEALRDTGSANQRISRQLEQTDTLLNKYIGILSKSEEFTRLIFDQQWQGAQVDEEALERERLAAMEKARLDAEAKALASQQEDDRRRREEQEQMELAEKARVEQEKKERVVTRGGVRGVRGTRASMRGTGGMTRAASSGASLTRGRGATSTGTVTSKLPMPSTGVRPSASSSSTRGLPRGTR